MLETDESGMREVLNLDVSKIEPSPLNKRHGNLGDVKGLAESIKAQGLINPITVRPNADKKGFFEIITGERRWAAVKTFSKKIIAFVRALSDQEALEIIAVENLQREDLGPLEQAASLSDLMAQGKTIEEISARIGRPRQWIARRASLLNLSEKIRQAMNRKENPLTMDITAMEVVARFKEHIQEKFLEDGLLENCSDVEDLKHATEKYLFILSSAPWGKEGVFSAEDVSCLTCNSRTFYQPDLFGNVDSKKKDDDRCTDAECWKRKTKAFIEKRAAELKAQNDELILINGYGIGLGADHPLKKAAVESWQVKECKKGTPGAKQALVIEGESAGSVKWVKPDADVKAADKEPTLQERREGLNKKRVKAVMVDILNDIGGNDTERRAFIKEAEQKVKLRLAVVFGSLPDEEWLAEKKRMESAKSMNAETLIQIVAANALNALDRHLRACIKAEYFDAAYVGKVCGMLGLSYADKLKGATEKNPEPKSWTEK